MGFFGNLIGAVVKVAATPVAIVKDVVDVAIGETPKTTKKIIESAVEDTKDSFEDLMDGDL